MTWTESGLRLQRRSKACSSVFDHYCRLTQRWEASLWLEGRQLYLGGFQTELDAARAYDIAALSCKGPHVVTNYPEEAYAQELQETAGCSTVSCPIHLLLNIIAPCTFAYNTECLLWHVPNSHHIAMCVPCYVQMTNTTDKAGTTGRFIMNSAVKQVKKETEPVLIQSFCTPA